MSLNTFIKQRPHLTWYEAKPEMLSEGAVVEAVLNHGNFEDVRKLISILGIEKMATIFKSQIKRERINYDPKILNYFKLYFKKYAA